MTPPLTPFLNINKILISDKRSHFTLVFLKAACHANPGAERNFPGSRQNCQNLYKISLPACNLHQQYLQYLSDCKNRQFQVMSFH